MPRILIVDDEADSRMMLGQYLNMMGYDVGFANNGWEALLALDQWNFDLILLDIMMPGLDGVKFMEILRGYASKAKHLPVVIVTALDRNEAGSRMRDLPIDGIIEKRAQLFQDLLNTVKRILGEPTPAHRRPSNGGGAMN